MSLEIEAQSAPFREIIPTHSVLVADDDELTCIALEACLAKWNFHVTTVTSGLDAWRELQKANA
ncbi:MAG TPA: response regulator, partial [Candidatus Angelobacter sp.]|nr:response regulator [Candidatus Angelobacter sp.]